ncbi:MAG: hypothetical protein PHW11_08330 [Anaerolineaceae bacterium]|jgi:hypothetical protein|nr:hypothetical protein [Anaerolineaceae bacterium]MDD4042986.1 hypothetical protein [Anaerolineaceae bacterium]MDD4577523.1 hypothetical protein [Anaerolineaceae bacterium]
MKTKRLFASRLLTVMAAIILLSSFLAFSSIPQAKAESVPEGEQGIQADVSNAWITSYNDVGNLDDIVALPFGKFFGYNTQLSGYVGEVFDPVLKSYVINWRPLVTGSSLRVCGLRVAYKLPVGGGFEPGFHYVHVAGSALLPRGSNVEWRTDSSGGCIYLVSGDPRHIFNINLNIPEGSRIDYLRIYYYRHATNFMYLPLIRKP